MKISNAKYKKNILRKKITMAFVYGFILLISTVAFYFVNTSKAQTILKLAVSVIDEEANVEFIKYDLKIPEEENSYKAKFNSIQNGFKIKKFKVISEKEFKEQLSKYNEEKTNDEKDSKIEEEEQEPIPQENENQENIKEDDENSKVEKIEENENTNVEETISKEITENSTENVKPKEQTKKEENTLIEIEPEKNYELTKEQLEDKKIYLLAQYDYKELNNKKLYNKIISKSINNNNISITGYMPQEAEISVKEVDEKEVEDNIKQNSKDDSQKINLTNAYDIKILVNGEEFEPEDFDEDSTVTITNNESKKVNIWHVKNDNTIEQINPQIENKNITFTTNEFSIYGIEIVEEGEIEQQDIILEKEQTIIEDEKNELKDIKINAKAVRRGARNLPDSTLEINDYDSDYYYYMGQNYTNTISGAHSNLYSDSNLVRVTLNYYGFAQNETDNDKKGRISIDDGETQDIVSNIKCVPVENGNVTIELMANPFMDKPTGYGFGGWTSSDGTVSQDNTKTQKIVATASSNMTINLYANWTAASVVYVNGDTGNDNVNNGLTEDTPFGSWGAAFSYLSSHNMQNRENNIIVVTGNMDSGINYTRAVTQTTSKPVLTYKFQSSTSIVTDDEVILSVGQGAGSNAISTNQNNGVTNVSVPAAANVPDTSKWIITSSGGGYSIQNVSTGYYLAYNNGLVMQTDPYEWTYNNRRFYATVTTTGWFPRTYYYYIRYNNGWKTSTNQNQRNSILLCSSGSRSI